MVDVTGKMDMLRVVTKVEKMAVHLVVKMAVRLVVMKVE